MANTTVINNATINLALADGNVEAESFEIPFRFKADVDSRIQSRVATLAYDIATKFSGVTKGYISMLPAISNIIAEESWKELDNCKNLNQFLIAVTGCSKATASELSKVAKCFYSSGELMTGYECFSYSELILLADPKLDDCREEIRERLAAKGKVSRKELKNILQEERAKAIEAKNNEEYGDDTQEAPDSSEGAADDSTVDLEPENETPTQTGDSEADGEWDNVDNTFARIDKFLTQLSEKLKSMALDKSLSKTNLQELLLSAGQGVESFLNDNYGETSIEVKGE